MGNSLNKPSSSSTKNNTSPSSEQQAPKKSCSGCKCKHEGHARSETQAASFNTSSSPVVVAPIVSGDIIEPTIKNVSPEPVKGIELEDKESLSEPGIPAEPQAATVKEAEEPQITEIGGGPQITEVKEEPQITNVTAEPQVIEVNEEPQPEQVQTENTYISEVNNAQIEEMHENASVPEVENVHIDQAYENIQGAVVPEVEPAKEPIREDLHEFSIANKKLKLDSAKDVEQYVQLINKHPELKVIALNGNTLGVEPSKALAAAIESLNNIEEFYLNDCFTGRMKEEVPVAIEAFNQVLKSKSTLKKVDFSDNALGPVGAKAVAVLLSEAVNLQEIVLNNNGLGPEGGKIIAQALIDRNTRQCQLSVPSLLRRIEIGRNRLENGSAGLMSQALKSHGCLEEIAFPQNGIRPEGIITLSEGIGQNPSLVKLNLQDNTFTDSGSVAFAAAVEKLGKLCQLNVGDCLLGSSGCESIINALVNSKCPIDSLNLQYNEMNEQGVYLLVKSLDHFPNLKVLMLNGNSFNPVGGAAQAVKDRLEKDNRTDILDSWSDMEYYSDEEDILSSSESEEIETEPAPQPEKETIQTLPSESSNNDLADKLATLDIVDKQSE